MTFKLASSFESEEHLLTDNNCEHMNMRAWINRGYHRITVENHIASQTSHPLTFGLATI